TVAIWSDLGVEGVDAMSHASQQAVSHRANFAEQVVEAAAGDDDRARHSICDDRSVSWFVVEEGQLSEVVATGEGGDLFTFADDLHVARGDDEELVARLTFDDQRRAVRHGSQLGPVGDVPELGRRACGEHGHRSEVLHVQRLLEGAHWLASWMARQTRSE